jgi:predicted RNA-binding Zn ribbon-like protein
MYTASPKATELRITLEVLVLLVNGLVPSGVDDEEPMGPEGARQVLGDNGFSRASRASAAALDRLVDRVVGLAPLLRSLPELSVAQASARINEELTELTITPAVVDHDGVGPHLHWTPSSATFDDQVVADLLMAVAQELCDRGTDRFGRCGAAECDRFFYDTTRNGSRRFCDDPRCASRTHTASHRSRSRRLGG